VRAAAESAIPLIAAVGHETDNTLIDFAADRRAPTPTAAAEMAVPVRAELLAEIAEHAHRLTHAIARALQQRRTLVQGLARGLPDPARLIEEKMQRLDGWTERLGLGVAAFFRRRHERLAALAARIGTPDQQIARKNQALGHAAVLLGKAVEKFLQARDRRLERATAALKPKLIRDRLERAALALENAGKLLDSFSYKHVLERGFVLVRDAEDRPVTRAAAVAPGMRLALGFADGTVPAVAEGGGARPAGAKPAAAGKGHKGGGGTEPQGSLL